MVIRLVHLGDKLSIVKDFNTYRELAKFLNMKTEEVKEATFKKKVIKKKYRVFLIDNMNSKRSEEGLNYFYKIRKRLGLSIDELANKLNISSCSIRNYERGKTIPGHTISEKYRKIELEIC